MLNPRITKKELNLIKGALRRVFSRSELRRKVLEAYTIEHSDDNRPRVGKWAYCPQCGVVTPRYLLEVDHIDPVVQIGETLEQMSWDSLVDRLWCEPENLAAICKTCHKAKSKREANQRKRARDEQRRKTA